uniref:Putative histone h1b n=1 Tax=Anopheles triannulatus TaxID=58253 RepID=A0A2M4AWN3_9DIPT
MTRDTVNLMETIVQQIRSGQCSRGKVRVRKRYLADDPSSDGPTPCPRCAGRDQRNMVRFLYINLSEAIYKCEAPDCMYPFGNYKYKNFETNTVYQYDNPEEAIPFCDVASTGPLDSLAPAYFNLDFDPPQLDRRMDSVTETESKSLSSNPPAPSFDVDVFDEILKDLWSSTSSANATPTPERPSSTLSALSACEESSKEPVSSSNLAQPAKSRKLEKCLKAVEQTKTKMRKNKFKYPRKHKVAEPMVAKHVVETISETKLRITKIPAQLPKDLRGANKVVLNNFLKGLVYDKDIKPAEFMDTLRNVSRRTLIGPSDKTQQMLHFINKSMDSRENKDSLRESASSSAVQSSNPANDAPGSSPPLASTEEAPFIKITTSEAEHDGGMDLLIKLLE